MWGTNNIAELLGPRLDRWNFAIANAPLSDEDLIVDENLLDAESLLRIIRDLQKGVAPCVVAAMLHTWLNGWCTSRRFQGTVVNCVFGCQNAKDEVERYVICPCLWACAAAALRLSETQVRTGRSLLIAPLAGESVCLLALRNYAALGSYNLFRQGQHCNSTLLQVYRERVRKAAVLNRNTSKLLKDTFARV